MTNSDKTARIRARMAETGEPFNVARRNSEGQRMAPAPVSDQSGQMIEVEVGEGTGTRQSYRRRTEFFQGRWIIEPVPDETVTQERGHPSSSYFGVAETGRGRIAVYTGTTNPLHAPRLDAFDTLAEAQMPEDIRRRASGMLGHHEVVHRDI